MGYTRRRQNQHRIQENMPAIFGFSPPRNKFTKKQQCEIRIGKIRALKESLAKEYEKIIALENYSRRDNLRFLNTRNVEVRIVQI